MSQAAKAQEPSMEEILASIRRIIADDDEGKPAASAPEPPPVPASPQPAAAAAPQERRGAAKPPPAVEPKAMSQDDIDSMLAGFDDEQEATKVESAAPQKDSADVLELTEAMEAKPSPPESHTIDANSGAAFTDALETALRSPADMMSRGEDEGARSLLSHHATAAVTSAFGSLAHTVLVQNAQTLDDLVRDMLRPMLKTWLDDNLPTIVERLVRAEIERVSRGR